MIHLSHNFDLYEFLQSGKYPLIAENLAPDLHQIDSLRLLCESCLQPLRDRFGYAEVLSGFRSEALNTAVGGADDSDHLAGAAGDVTLPNALSFAYLFWWARRKLPYRQLIWYRNARFFHVSVNIPGKTYRHEAFVIG